MKKVNISLISIISMAMGLAFAIWATLSTQVNSVLFWIIAFPYYILGHIEGGGGLGIGILFEFFGPILISIAWFIILTLIVYLYYTIFKKEIFISSPDKSTILASIICGSIIILTNIFFIAHLFTTTK